MPRIVIDASASTDPSLGDWLERSASNIAILTEEFFIEAYRRGDPDRVPQSFVQLNRRPAQIKILQSAFVLSNLPPRERGATRRMLDQKATHDFPRMLRDLQKLPDNEAVRQRIQDRIDATRELMTESQEIFSEMGGAIQAIADTFAPNDLQSMRRGENYSRSAVQTILTHIVDLTKIAYSARQKELPSNKELIPNSFLFRHSLCSYLIFKSRYEKGTVGNHLRSELARNDIVDSLYATAALYFDGLRSKDETLMRCYSEARYLMDQLYLPQN